MKFTLEQEGPATCRISLFISSMDPLMRSSWLERGDPPCLARLGYARVSLG